MIVAAYRDAKAQGRQGNIMLDAKGQMVVASDDEMGSACGDRYRWGQNEREVTIKKALPAGTRAKSVKLVTKSKHLSLSVDGESVCEGELHKNIISDETTFELTDQSAADGGGRLLTVTMTKSVTTKGKDHWRCAIKGEARINPSRFGPSVVTVNPNDPNSMNAALGYD